MDEVHAFFFLADAWIKVKPQTIQNCWDHKTILDFKFSDGQTIELEDVIPTSELPLEDGLVTRLNQIILDLRGNRNDDCTPLVEDVEGLYLNADETDEIVFPPSFAKSDKTNDRTEESQVLEVEEDDPETSNVDLKEIAEKLKHAYKVILYHTVPTNDKDKAMLKTIRINFEDIRSEEILQRQQTDLRNYYFQHV
ncbi:hypothetical protein V8B55DRAFT_1580188 [Mucor lusitanicus]|uniref:DDE-1 domain-containing protein n=2 Tax=Mucor circinelloides f. lusitanicus TaxID=29924 RepID=A0A168NN56_MUCCL|nr:hypothetical protein FB192DRAFT_1449600 [Mucor lusitanicus]OAD06508.1 hypothetical protein MUCCIDRAFT_107084 [Mucor lusitanicus CBS 277.49]